MTIKNIDHLVLTTENIEKIIRFYTEILGMQEITFKGGRKALAFGNQKINLHKKGNEFEPKAKHPTAGAIDICLIANDPIEEILQELNDKNIPIIEGIVERTGAKGKIKSIYINDPDGNLIEISKYF